MKKLPIKKCSECKHVVKGHRWKHSDGSVYYVKTWKCSLENIEICIDEIIYEFENFNAKNFIKDITCDIPKWCPLEDEHLELGR